MKILNILGCSGQNSSHGQESGMSGILKPKILISYTHFFSPKHVQSNFLNDLFSFLINSGGTEIY